jgi:hypothetical protein
MSKSKQDDMADNDSGSDVEEVMIADVKDKLEEKQKK